MKIELHAHTRETSPCGKLPARELISRFAGAGYGALVVTDHLIGQASPERSVSERVEFQLAGYRAAREAGEQLGVRVFLGAEVRFPRGPEDFLIYGLAEADFPWLIALVDSDPGYGAFHEALREKGLIWAQAHPFRRGLRPVERRFLDGVEVYNGNPRHDNHNSLAMFYGLRGGISFLRLSGSDAHQVMDVGRGGVISPGPIGSNAELVAFLRATPDPLRVCTP